MGGPAKGEKPSRAIGEGKGKNLEVNTAITVRSISLQYVEKSGKPSWIISTDRPSTALVKRGREGGGVLSSSIILSLIQEQKSEHPDREIGKRVSRGNMKTHPRPP